MAKYFFDNPHCRFHIYGALRLNGSVFGTCCHLRISSRSWHGWVAKNEELYQAELSDQSVLVKNIGVWDNIFQPGKLVQPGSDWKRLERPANKRLHGDPHRAA